MSGEVTDDTLRNLIKTLHREPMEPPRYDENWIRVGRGSLSINRHRAAWSVGYGGALYPASRFYRRWFELADLDLRGWAIVFRVCEPEDVPGEKLEYLAGWVPPEREAEAEEWVGRLNAEIRARLAGNAREGSSAP